MTRGSGSCGRSGFPPRGMGPDRQQPVSSTCPATWQRWPRQPIRWKQRTKVAKQVARSANIFLNAMDGATLPWRQFFSDGEIDFMGNCARLDRVEDHLCRGGGTACQSAETPAGSRLDACRHRGLRRARHRVGECAQRLAGRGGARDGVCRRRGTVY